MLKAKLDSVRKNKKGFSLVELIIVMAIMVALIAVLAPQFVKYVQRARDSSVTDAANNVFEVVKSEYALGNIAGTGTIVVKSGADGNSPITLTVDGLSKCPNANDDIWGIDTGKKVNSALEYTITIATDGSGYPVFSMTDNSTAA